MHARGSQQQLPSRQAVEIFDLGPDVRIEITGAIRLVRFEWRRRIEARLRLLREPVHHGRSHVAEICGDLCPGRRCGDLVREGVCDPCAVTGFARKTPLPRGRVGDLGNALDCGVNGPVEDARAVPEDEPRLARRRERALVPLLVTDCIESLLDHPEGPAEEHAQDVDARHGPAMLTRDEVRPQALHSICHHASLVAGGVPRGRTSVLTRAANRDEVRPQAGFIPAVPGRFIPFATTRRWWQEGVPRGRTSVLTRALIETRGGPKPDLFPPSPGASFPSPP